MLNSTYPKARSKKPMQKLAFYGAIASILLSLSPTAGFTKEGKYVNTFNAAPANVAKQPEKKASEKEVKVIADKPSDVAPTKEPSARPVESAKQLQLGELKAVPRVNPDAAPPGSVPPAGGRRSFGVSPSKGGYIGEMPAEDALRKYFVR
jgi:hypothetical protein